MFKLIIVALVAIFGFAAAQPYYAPVAYTAPAVAYSAPAVAYTAPVAAYTPYYSGVSAYAAPYAYAFKK